MNQTGSITAPLLIISSSLIIVVYALVFLLTTQLDLTFRQTAFDQSLYIAEAGIQYYRWHLAHAPEDFKDGKSIPGPYIHDYQDPGGENIGKFSLDIIAPQNGSSIVTISSTGWMNDYPSTKRTIQVRYGVPSLTKYSFLCNASSWYGTGLTINGKVHSNTGIRMDSLNTSLVTSSQSTYTCGDETGCSPSRIKNGVWGAGANSSLWQFPAPPVDFDAISFDFNQMKTAAQTKGTYKGASGKSGYHVIFKNTGTYDIYRVDSTAAYSGYSVDGGCQSLNQRISRETYLGNYSTTTKPIIFLEDHVWVEGIVSGKVTLAAFRFPISSNAMNIWIKNNLVYKEKNGQNDLGLIAQNDIYFVRDLPDTFEINGALMAQKGKIIRHGYLPSCGGATQAVKTKLTIFGSVLSYQKSYWNFGEAPTSGFRSREITYDASLLFSPPPYFPNDGNYEFISWEEK